jgi:integrase
MWTHAKPIIGHIALEKFSVDDVKELYKTLKARKRFRKSDQTYHEVPSVAQKVGRVVSRAINVAINEGKYNQLNPFARVTRPRHISKRGRAFNEDELGCFLDAAFGDRYYAFWVLLIDAGVRQSEAFGLEWTDIDFKKAQIHITKQRLEGKGGSYIARTKTEAGNRTIQINNVTVAALRVHQKSKNATSQRYVFTTETGGRPTRTNLRSRHFLPICKAAGLTGPGLRIHGTRHTMTSILLANGHPVHVVQGRLGHASKVMVGLYSHVQPGQDRKLADTMERYTKSRARKRNSQ